jgi:hypothetical protein
MKEKMILAIFTTLLAIFKFYWRKKLFIGDIHTLIGENQNILANWKFRTFFSSLLILTKKDSQPKVESLSEAPKINALRTEVHDERL